MSVFSYPLGSYEPFVVYATDAPSFPSDEIWPYDPCLERKRSIYGRRPGGLLRLFRPVTCSVERLDGSMIVMSGGHLSPDDANGTERRPMCMSGLLDAMHDDLDRLAEQAIAGLINPDDRVTMLRYVSRDSARDYIATIREAGFEVIETGDVTPGVDSAYALCRGTGRMLGACEWLDEIWGYEPFFLLANRGPHSLLESGVLEAALAKTDPQSPQIQCLKHVQRRPQAAEKVFGRGYVYVSTTDPDGNSLHIIRQDPDTSGLHNLFSRTAETAGLALFDAGSLSQPDSDGHYFTEFKSWERSMPMPEHWRRII